VRLAVALTVFVEFGWTGKVAVIVTGPLVVDKQVTVAVPVPVIDVFTASEVVQVTPEPIEEAV
jgi:hypothetical protein